MKSLLNSVHIVATSLLLYHYWYHNQSNNGPKNFGKPFPKSSVWCTGTDNTNRQCRFENLCYFKDRQEFIFLHGDDSIISGVPADRFNPALAELSSVENHNQQYFHYTDFPAGILRDINISFIDTPTLLFNRFHPDNLMHIIHDDLLPLYMSSKYANLKDIQVMFLDRKPHGAYFELYDILLEKKSFIQELNTSSYYCFRDARVGVNKETTWYQYGFRSPQGPLEKNNTYSAHQIKGFRDHMLGKIGISPNDTAFFPKSLVLLTRKNNRLITNEGYLVLTMSKIAKNRVQTLNLEKNTLKEIIEKIHGAGLLVGMHGSLLALSIFLPAGSALVELFPYAIDPEQYTPYKTLANMPGLDLLYYSWNNKNLKKTITHPRNPPELGGINHLPQNVQKQIQESTMVPPHLCCSDPEWLFRIYQDTNIELRSFGDVFAKASEDHKSYIKELKNRQEKPDHRLIFPSEVQMINCSSPSEGILRVQWSEPWNLNYINTTTLEYELWIQEVNTEDVKAYLMKARKYEFILKPKRNYYLWVRCIRDGLKGAFTKFTLCKVL